MIRRERRGIVIPIALLVLVVIAILGLSTMFSGTAEYTHSMRMAYSLKMEQVALAIDEHAGRTLYDLLQKPNPEAAPDKAFRKKLFDAIEEAAKKVKDAGWKTEKLGADVRVNLLENDRIKDTVDLAATIGCTVKKAEIVFYGFREAKTEANILWSSGEVYYQDVFSLAGKYEDPADALDPKVNDAFPVPRDYLGYYNLDLVLEQKIGSHALPKEFHFTHDMKVVNVTPPAREFAFFSYGNTAPGVDPKDVPADHMAKTDLNDRESGGIKIFGNRFGRIFMRGPWWLDTVGVGTGIGGYEPDAFKRATLLPALDKFHSNTPDRSDATLDGDSGGLKDDPDVSAETDEWKVRPALSNGYWPYQRASGERKEWFGWGLIPGNRSGLLSPDATKQLFSKLGDEVSGIFSGQDRYRNPNSMQLSPPRPNYLANIQHSNVFTDFFGAIWDGIKGVANLASFGMFEDVLDWIFKNKDPGEIMENKPGDEDNPEVDAEQKRVWSCAYQNVDKKNRSFSLFGDPFTGLPDPGNSEPEKFPLHYANYFRGVFAYLATPAEDPSLSQPALKVLCQFVSPLQRDDHEKPDEPLLHCSTLLFPDELVDHYKTIREIEIDVPSAQEKLMCILPEGQIFSRFRRVEIRYRQWRSGLFGFNNNFGYELHPFKESEQPADRTMESFYGLYWAKNHQATLAQAVLEAGLQYLTFFVTGIFMPFAPALLPLGWGLRAYLADAVTDWVSGALFTPGSGCFDLGEATEDQVKYYFPPWYRNYERLVFKRYDRLTDLPRVAEPDPTKPLRLDGVLWADDLSTESGFSYDGRGMIFSFGTKGLDEEEHPSMTLPIVPADVENDVTGDKLDWEGNPEASYLWAITHHEKNFLTLGYLKDKVNAAEGKYHLQFKGGDAESVLVGSLVCEHGARPDPDTRLKKARIIGNYVNQFPNKRHVHEDTTLEVFYNTRLRSWDRFDDTDPAKDKQFVDGSWHVIGLSRKCALFTDDRTVEATE